MNGGDLAAEMRAALAALTEEHRAELLDAGIPRPLFGQFLIGAALIRLSGDGALYEPDPEGAPAYLVPALVDDPATPESTVEQYEQLGALVDVVAWHPRHPERWALRCGVAEWLGHIEPQYLDPAPVNIWRGPLSWFRAGCSGLVILGREPVDTYRIVAGLGGGALAEDREHALTLRRILRRPWPLPRIEVARAA